MKRAYAATKRILIFGSTLALWTLVFVNEAAAPPPPPPPPSASASGTIAQIAAIAVVGVYGAFKLLRKK